MNDNEVTTISKLYQKHRPDNEISSLTPLWHYTSVDGLMGIVSKEEQTLHFWFTRSDCLNDTSEGRHIIELFRSVCSELYEQGDIDESFWEITKSIDISPYHLISYPLPPTEDYVSCGMVDAAQCEAYICCFSLKEDSLDMWRYYSKNSGGYAIKLLPIIFNRQKEYKFLACNKDNVFYCIESFKVIYDYDEKMSILKGLVADAYNLYRYISGDLNEIEEMKKCVSGILQSYQYRFKHECFASEQEFRFVCYRPTVKPELLINALPEVCYRSQNGVIVPYIDIAVKDAYILEVLISPLIENQSSENTTQEFLKSRGFPNCTVRKSKLPTR